MITPHHVRVSALPFSGVLLGVAVAGWLLACAFGGVAAAQTGGDDAIGFEAEVAPDDLGPGDAFTITGTVTVDPDAVDGGPLAWTLTIGPVAGAAFDDTACGNSTGTSCQAELSAAGDTVTVSGEVVTTPRGNVTAEVRIAGTVDATPGSDQASMTAATCGVVTAPGGTTVPGAGGRLSQGPAPEEGTPESTCAGVTGTIEAPITVPTPAPTEAPTEEPTEAPTATPEPTATEEPTATPTEEPTATPTPEPTEAPTEEPTATATEAPTATATLEPTATATQEPTATSTQEPTATPTEEPTATVTTEPMATPTEEPTATATEQPTDEPTAMPTDEPSATPEPTATATEAPTESPTATPEPTATTTVEPTATVASATATTAPTAAAQPTPDEGGDGSTGLWIGAGALALLAAAAGVVWYQRRKVSA